MSPTDTPTASAGPDARAGSAAQHRASHRAARPTRGRRSERLATPERPVVGGSHRGTQQSARPGRRRLTRSATLASGLASVATMIAIGGGVLSAGSPALEAAGQLAAAATGPTVAPRPLSAAQLAARARVPVSRSDRRDAVDQGKAATLATVEGPAVTGSENIAEEDPRTIARALLVEFGFSSDQFSCLDPLWTGESGWRINADNPSSSAYGIPQALPGSKMSTAGPDWATNPVTQIRWGLGYIQERYGSPCGAWSFKQGHGWY